MIYKITIKGHVDNKWSDWFNGLQITHQKDGTTTLHGRLPDQAALHKIFRKIRDLNLQLVSVKQFEIDVNSESLSKPEGGADI